MDFFGRPKASAPPAPTTTDASAAPPKAIPWVEKYRPRTIDDVAAQGEVVQVLRTSLETKNLPHLLFYGPPGTGKTSTILALTRTMYGTAEAAKTRVLELNASDERGIAVVREKVKTFARAAVGSRTTTQGQQLPPYKIVILDEADSMTSDAQAALRRIIEKYSRVTRFCLVCNYVSRIIEPLASRCAKFRFKPVPSDNAVQCLSMVAHRESVVCRDGALDELVRCTDGDLRRATMALQSAARIVPVDGALDPQIVRDVVGLIPDHVILALRASWGATETHAARALVDDLVYNGFPASRVLSQLHDVVVNDELLTSLQKAKIAVLMAAVDKALNDGADEQLQLLDLMLQASIITAQCTLVPSS